jgi:hypothetical protein
MLIINIQTEKETIQNLEKKMHYRKKKKRSIRLLLDFLFKVIINYANDRDDDD